MQIIGVVKFIGRHVEVADAFAQAQESWNESPAEKGVNGPADRAFQIEIMDAEGTQKKAKTAVIRRSSLILWRSSGVIDEKVPSV